MDFNGKKDNSPKRKQTIEQPKNYLDPDMNDSDGDSPGRVECYFRMVTSKFQEVIRRRRNACGSPQSLKECKRVRYHGSPSMISCSNESSDPSMSGPSVNLSPSFSNQSNSVIASPLLSHCTSTDEVLQDYEDEETIAFTRQESAPPSNSSSPVHITDIETVNADTSTEEHPENGRFESEEEINVQEYLEEVVDVENRRSGSEEEVEEIIDVENIRSRSVEDIDVQDNQEEVINIETENIPITTDLRFEMSTTPLQSDYDFKASIMGLLECPVCYDYIVPPIYQCERGHLICYACKPHLFICPTCRSLLTNTRNLAMEKVAEKLKYPCKNRVFGCLETFKIKDKGTHEDSCDFRSVQCFTSRCEWRGLITDIIDHFSQVHGGAVLFGKKHNLYVNLNDYTTNNYNWMVKAYTEIFRVHFFITAQRSQIYGCVQYIGPKENATNFSYTLKISNHDQPVALKRCLAFERTTHSDLDNTHQIYPSGDCLFLRSDLADLLSDEANILHCELILSQSNK